MLSYGSLPLRKMAAFNISNLKVTSFEPFLHLQVSDSLGLRFVMKTCQHSNVFYSVSVRQTENLPPDFGVSSVERFLQIPPRAGHPYLELTLPTIKRRVQDLHSRVITVDYALFLQAAKTKCCLFPKNNLQSNNQQQAAKYFS